MNRNDTKMGIILLLNPINIPQYPGKKLPQVQMLEKKKCPSKWTSGAS